MTFIIEHCDAQLIQKGAETFTGVSTDTRTLQPGQLFIPLVGPHFNGHDFIAEAIARGATAVLISELRSEIFPEEVTVLFVADTLMALQMLAQAYLREVHPRKIAITGSVGKTTTKELIDGVLSEKYKTYKNKGNYNNHIGLPLTLLDMPADTEVLVVEMGMNHEGEIRRLAEMVEPDIAVITNIGDSHIEYFGSREAILKAKMEIAENFTDQQSLFVNGDDALLKGACQTVPVCVSVGTGTAFAVTDYDMTSDFKSRFTVQCDAEMLEVTLALPGRHNASNTLFAVAIGHQLGLTKEAIKSGLEKTKPLPMRLQPKKINNMILIDDTYNASPDSVLSAAQVLISTEATRRILVFADILELGELSDDIHRQLGERLGELKLTKIMCYGPHSKQLINAIDQFSTAHFESADALAEALKSEATAGDAILFKGSRGMHVETVFNALLERG